MQIAVWRWRIGRFCFAAQRLRDSIATRGFMPALRNAVARLSARMQENRELTLPAYSYNTARVKNSLRILVIDAALPDPSRDSGSVRMVELLTLLRDNAWEIDFIPDNGILVDPLVKALRAIGVVVHSPGYLPALLNGQAHVFDAALLSRHAVAARHMALIKKKSPRTRIVFDTVDLHFLRESRTASLSHDVKAMRKAERSRNAELSIIQSAHATLVVSAYEKVLLSKLAPDAQVELVSNIHCPDPLPNTFEQRDGILFIGGYRHDPNRDAMKWLVSEIFPLIRAELPDVRLHLIGEMPPHVDEALRADGVDIHGHVASLRPWLGSCRVAVAPLRVGAGVKGKVNTAMSHGLPTVLTPVAAEGMAIVDRQHALVAESALLFAQCVIELYTQPILWNQLSINGLENVREHFSPQAAAIGLFRALGHPMHGLTQ